MKGRNRIGNVIVIVIDIVVMRAAVVITIVVTIAIEMTVMILILERRLVIGKGIQKRIERENADATPTTKRRVQSMAINPQTRPLMITIVAVARNVEDIDLLETEEAEMMERKVTA